MVEAHCGEKTMEVAVMRSPHRHEPSQRLPLPQPVGSRAGMLQAKQPTGQEQSPINQQTGCLKFPEHSPAQQRDKTHLHPQVESLPSESLHKPLRQPHPPEDGQQKQELQSCSLWNENCNHRKLDKMRQQRNMSQMKEQDKTQEEQLSEVG